MLITQYYQHAFTASPVRICQNFFQKWLSDNSVYLCCNLMSWETWAFRFSSGWLSLAFYLFHYTTMF